MHHYELVCIIHPDLDEAAFNALVEKVKSWVEEIKGSVDKVDIWGRRRLAYMIKKQHEGQYILFNLSLEPTVTATLEQNLRFQESILRYMITSIK
jgi:small subunit ribosomal protein S6